MSFKEKFVETKDKAVEGIKKHKGAIIGTVAGIATGAAAIIIAKAGMGGNTDEYDGEYDCDSYDADYELVDDNDEELEESLGEE